MCKQDTDPSFPSYFRGRCLYRFLISKGLYRQYLFNSANQFIKNGKKVPFNPKDKETVLKWLHEQSIMSAFGWFGSLEGGVFWRSVNDEWTKSYRKIGVKILDNVK